LKSVVFYVSGHGFGHASREVEIIHALHARRPDVRVLMRSAVSPALFQRTLTVPFELLPGPCDTGIVQASSIQHDDAATVREAIAFYADYGRRIDDEVKRVAGERIDLVVGDIAPIAFEVASRLGVPSVAIANFTWDWIYETHPGLSEAAPWLVARIRESYRKATRALRLPFHGGFEVFSDTRPMPLVTRHPTRARADTRRHFAIAEDRPAALLSFGGYGLPDLDLNAIDALTGWTMVTTDRSSTAPSSSAGDIAFVPEAAFIDSGFRYEDLVAAVDVVVTKPGYGIIAECVACHTAMVYTSRGQFREYDVLVGEMPNYVRCQFISQDDLLAGRLKNSLAQALNQPEPREPMTTDGAEVAADELSALLDASRSA